jgi:hypothetical protein
MTNSTKEQNFVDFEALAWPAAETQAPTTHFLLNIFHSDGQPCREPFHNNYKGLTMRFTGSEIAQHRL